MSLKQFLLKVRGVRPQAFVTGNQSADMDSTICALVYAYYAQLAEPSTWLVPLINIPRADFRLRRDIVMLLQQHDIVESDLFFLEDLLALTSDLSAASGWPLHLVDHCNVQGTEITELVEQGNLKVVLIIDHHADEGVFTDATPRVIAPLGSCTSHVWNWWHSRLGARAEIPGIVRLLLGPLLIDTGNMTLKVEDVDRAVLAEYREVLKSEETEVSLASIEEAWYQLLKKAKKDVLGFSLGDVLRKDYKQFNFNGVEIGFLSIGKLFAWVLTTYDDAHIKNAVAKMVADHQLDALIVTLSYTAKDTKQYTREFGIHARQPLNLDYAIDKLQLGRPNALPRTSGSFEIWNQGDVLASRKQVVPIVKEAVEHHQS